MAVKVDENPEKEMPKIHIDLEQMPSMKGWKLGKVYPLKARLVSKVEALDDRPECYDFEIVGGKAEEESDSEDSKESNENDDYGYDESKSDSGDD